MRIDPLARRLHDAFEADIKLPLEHAYTQVALARRHLFGDSVYPDATGTLRLAFGRVMGYVHDQKLFRAWTTIGEGLKHPADTFPNSWRQAKRADRNPVPLNFVSTADTIGGNSGSPVINRRAELVGVNFDSNAPKLEQQKFRYSGGAARHISVDVRAIRQVLTHVYRADELVDELWGSTARAE